MLQSLSEQIARHDKEQWKGFQHEPKVTIRVKVHHAAGWSAGGARCVFYC